jgi:hypothetical protein
MKVPDELDRTTLFNVITAKPFNGCSFHNCALHPTASQPRLRTRPNHPYVTLTGALKCVYFGVRGGIATVMLELRPNCEWCDRDLPPTAADARICTYECTYCADCVENVLRNVCPTCGGNFAPRPIRPLRETREGSGLGRLHHPPSEKRRHSKWTREQVDAHAQQFSGISPDER